MVEPIAIGLSKPLLETQQLKLTEAAVIQ